MNTQGNDITYVLMKIGIQDIKFYKKEGKNFAEVPKGTRVTAANGGWLLEAPDGSNATLEGKPVILIQ